MWSTCYPLASAKDLLLKFSIFASPGRLWCDMCASKCAQQRQVTPFPWCVTSSESAALYFERARCPARLGVGARQGRHGAHRDLTAATTARLLPRRRVIRDGSAELSRTRPPPARIRPETIHRAERSLCLCTEGFERAADRTASRAARQPANPFAIPSCYVKVAAAAV